MEVVVTVLLAIALMVNSYALYSLSRAIGRVSNRATGNTNSIYRLAAALRRLEARLPHDRPAKVVQGMWAENAERAVREGDLKEDD